MIEFKLYNRIVKGDLRPNLPVYNEEKGLASLREKFFTGKIKFIKENKVEFDENMDLDFHGFQEGDVLLLKTPEDDSLNISIEIQKNTEDDLINIDIPPPIDKKSELFFRIIESEYNRVEAVFSRNLEDFNSSEELRNYVLVNIQYLKRVGEDAHNLQKVLKKENVDDWRNSNTLILHSLKKHIVYSIIHIQGIYYPILQLQRQFEYELEDELFEMGYTKMMRRVDYMAEQIDKLFLKRLHEQIGEASSLDEKISFFKEKFEEYEVKIEQSKGAILGIPNYLVGNKLLIKKELSNLLAIEYEKRLHAGLESKSISDRYIHIIEFLSDIKLNKYNNDLLFLENSDFFEKANIEIEKLEKIISLNINRSKDIKSDLLSILTILQSRKYLALSEDQLNDYMSDLLRMKQYYVTDQTRSGRSGSENEFNYRSGELDIALRDIRNNGKIITIIEAFELTSCGDENQIIRAHVNKLLNRYDTSGNKENFVVVYARAKRFNDLWENFKHHVSDLAFGCKINFFDDTELVCDKSALRSGYQIVSRENQEVIVNYLFVNMKV